MIAGASLHKLAAFYILAAQASCPILPAPKVTMTFANIPPVEINAKSSAELGQYHISTTFSHSRNEIFTVGGLTVSHIDPAYRILFNTTSTEDGMVCVSLAQVGIAVSYAPLIYISSETKAGSCRYKATLQHEVRHVNTDIITFNEYLPQMTAAVQAALDHMPPIPPVPAENAVDVQNRMMDLVRAALGQKTDELEHVRAARQQMIDTRQEYLRGTALCPGE